MKDYIYHAKTEEFIPVTADEAKEIEELNKLMGEQFGEECKHFELKMEAEAEAEAKKIIEEIDKEFGEGGDKET